MRFTNFDWFQNEIDDSQFLRSCHCQHFLLTLRLIANEHERRVVFRRCFVQEIIVGSNTGVVRIVVVVYIIGICGVIVFGSSS